MSYQIFDQRVDLARGMHVVELRNEHGHKHIVQIAIGHYACISCGRAHPKGNLDVIDPRAMVQEVIDSLNASHEQMKEYAARHRIPLK